MTTQVRPLSGGVWNNVSQTTQKLTKKDTVYGVSLPAGYAAAALRACNQWTNASGVGTAATSAQETAKALGIQLQEI